MKTRDVGTIVSQASRCPVRGCGRPTWGCAPCRRCQDEIEALAEMARRRDERREQRRIRKAARVSFSALCVRVRRRLWILALAIGVAVLAWACGVAAEEWLLWR